MLRFAFSRSLVPAGALCLAAALIVPSLAAQDNATTVKSLRGLQGVHVAMAAVSPELKAKGVTTDVLFAAVVLQLRQAQIPILDELPKPPPDGPELRIEVLANVDPTFDQCSFSFRLELRQTARLERDLKSAPLRVVTWSIGGIGEASNDWRQVLREELDYYLGRFTAAYRAANPL